MSKSCKFIPLFSTIALTLNLTLSFFVAQMKKQFMDTMRNTGTLERLGGDNKAFFSRITFALAQAWTEMECDKCNNGTNCPMRVSVSRQQAEKRGEIEPRKKQDAPIDDHDPHYT